MTATRARIEDMTSRTAQYTCMSRASSFAERRETHKGPDYVAFQLIPGFFRLALRLPGMARFFGRVTAPKGIYEYVIARTRFMDARFKEALEQGFDQAIIFGAGFDSRAQRFQGINRCTRIFELDAPVTQEEKIKGLEKKGIFVPDQLTFVPVNFNRDSLEDRLAQAGYRPGLKTLYLLEGVLMYLDAGGVDLTLDYIQKTAGIGSRVAFDFVWSGAVDPDCDLYGARDIVKSVTKAGEGWTFFLDQGQAGELLGQYGFVLKELWDSRELEKRYFSDSQGRIAARINGTHALAWAEKG